MSNHLIALVLTVAACGGSKQPDPQTAPAPRCACSPRSEIRCAARGLDGPRVADQDPVIAEPLLERCTLGLRHLLARQQRRGVTRDRHDSDRTVAFDRAVLHGHHDVATGVLGLPGHDELDLTAWLGELGSVGAEVRQDLAHAGLVGVDDQARGHLHGQGMSPLLHQRRGQLDGARDQVGDLVRGAVELDLSLRDA